MTFATREGQSSKDDIMPQDQPSPFDKEPAEGSRETVDRQLEQQSRKTKTERGTADPVTVPDRNKAGEDDDG